MTSAKDKEIETMAHATQQMTTVEDESGRFLDKITREPFIPFGIAGAVCTLVYGAYKFKTRGNTPVSVHVIHMRMMAQGTIVTVMTAAMIYNMYKTYWLKEQQHEETKVVPSSWQTQLDQVEK